MPLTFSTQRVTPIGVEIAESCVRAVQYDRGVRGQRLRAAHAAPLPPEGDRMANLQLALRSLKDLGFRGRDVVASLPSDEVLVRPLKLPVGIEPGDAQFPQAWLAEARMSLPYDPREAVLDYLDLGPCKIEGATHYALLLLAARRNRVWRYLEAFRAAGLRCVQLESASTAAARMFKARTAAYALVDVDEQQTVVSIALGSRLLFSRVLRKGMFHVIESTAAALKLSLRDAEAMLAHFGFSSEQGVPVDFDDAIINGKIGAASISSTLTEICTRELDFLVQEIDRTFRYFLLQPCGCTVGGGLVCGDRLPPAMLEVLSQRLRLSLEFARADLAPEQTSFIKAAGLALRGSL